MNYLISDTNFHHVSKKNTFKTKSLPPSCNNFPLPLMKCFPKPYNNFIMTFFFRSCRIILWKIMVIFPKVLGCNEACEFVLAMVQLCTILILNYKNHFLFQVYEIWHDHELNLIRIEFILLSHLTKSFIMWRFNVISDAMRVECT
jgi:hypothetical protein